MEDITGIAWMGNNKSLEKIFAIRESGSLEDYKMGVHEIQYSDFVFFTVDTAADPEFTKVIFKDKFQLGNW